MVGGEDLQQDSNSLTIMTDSINSLSGHAKFMLQIQYHNQFPRTPLLSYRKLHYYYYTP